MNTSAPTAPTATFLHAVLRCVRGAFLCGVDPRTDLRYDHRLAWLDDRLGELAAIFAVRVHGQRALSQQLHLALEFDPGRVKDWSDHEVGERWDRLWHRAGLSEAEQAERIAGWLANEHKLADIRQRLASTSEFMRTLTQHIARKANIEDDCRGCFWEGRHRIRQLPDAGALQLAFLEIDCGRLLGPGPYALGPASTSPAAPSGPRRPG